MKAKYVIRPVRENDYDAFLDLARSTGGDLTNIPGDPEVVRARIDESVHSFDPKVHRAGSQRYLFVLEDPESRHLIGTSGVISKVGGFQPWYCYDLRKERMAFPPLGIDHEIEVLSPNSNYNGPSEICCLFLRPEYRKGGWGRLLSLSRFHFMAEFARRFDTQVIAELRGVTTKNNARTSPFWEAVARHFFQMDFQRADYLSGLDDKSFIGHLMPKHPLYFSLLPESARAVIGQPHVEAKPAMKLLMDEGFRYQGQVDIFDAGPIVEADIGKIRTVRERRKLPVLRLAEDADLSEREDLLLSNNRLDFRSCLGPVVENVDEGAVTIDRSTAAALEVKEGDAISFSFLRLTGQTHQKKETVKGGKR